MATPDADAPDKTSRNLAHRWSGWSLSLLLAAAWVALFVKIRPKHALDLREDGFALAIVAGSPLLFITFGCGLYWLVQGLSRLFVKQRPRWVPWAHLLVMTGGFLVPSTFVEPPNPVRPEDEAIYLRFADEARTTLGALNNHGLRLADPEPGMVGNERPAETAARQKLAANLPAYWPRRWLMVYLENDTVVLVRGAGLSGRVGVRIYKEPHRPTLTKATGPYMPVEHRITDHVWFSRSD